MEYFTTFSVQFLIMRETLSSEARTAITREIPASFYLVPLIQPGLLITIGVLLFVYSVPLAARIMPATEKTGDELPPHPLAAASVAFAAVGVAIFLNALPGVLNPILTQLHGAESALIRPAPLTGSQIPPIISAAVRLVPGFFLFFKARVFATAWWGKQKGWGNFRFQISDFKFQIETESPPAELQSEAEHSETPRGGGGNLKSAI